MKSTIKLGDVVMYIGNQTPELYKKTGKVIEVLFNTNIDQRVRVKWADNTIGSPFIKNLILVQKLDDQLDFGDFCRLIRL